ncbi:MAG: SDR family NAD(P)-dependent oxidoreductase [Myxococcota bacterium]
MSLPTPLHAVVTGAGSGLGRSLALELAGRGASLAISDIQLDTAEETAELVRRRGARAEVIACDVTNREQVFDLMNEAEARLGGVDMVCNNAGVAVGGPFGEISMDDWRWVVDINLWGVIYGCQAAIPKMRDRGRGYVLNVASAAGLLSPPGMSAYNVTKAGVVSLSETLYAEFRSAGIHVSVLCPTFFLTNIVNGGRGAAPDGQEAQIRKWMERSKVQAPEVAKAAVDALDNRQLYVQPMADGRNAWRLKRLAPQRFYDRLGALHDRTRARQKR